MNIDPAGEKQIREFLLGRLPEKDAEALEEQFLASDEMEELARLVEDEIIDQYVDGPLNRRDRRDIENHFLLPPARQKKLDFARMLRSRLRPPTPPQPNPGFLRLPLLFAGTAAAWILGGLLTMVSVGSGLYIAGVLKGPKAGTQQPRPQPNLAGNNNPAPPRPLLAKQEIDFAVGGIKSANPGEAVEISENTGMIEAHIPLFEAPSPTRSYAVKIQSEEGTQIISQDGLKPHSAHGGSELRIDIDPKLMPSGTWIALVTSSRKGAVTQKFYCTIK